MAGSVRFAEGMKKVIDGGSSSSSSTRLDDFPLLSKDPVQKPRSHAAASAQHPCSSAGASARADLGPSSAKDSSSSWSSLFSSSDVKL